MEKEPLRESNGKADKRSLLLRMHQEQIHIEIVRLVRYEGVPLAKARAAIPVRIWPAGEQDKWTWQEERLAPVDGGFAEEPA